MNVSRQKRLDRAQLRVLFQVPFFAPGVARLPVVWDDSIARACTDGQQIRWNGKFFDELPDPVLVTVLAHEVAHCLLGHLWRLPPPGGDMETANIACDHAVNWMLKDFSDLMTAKRLADPFPFGDLEKDICRDPAYKAMSEEQIYAKLFATRQGQGGQQGQGAGAGGRGVSGQGKGNQSAANGKGGPKPSGQNPSFGEFEAKPGKSAAAGKALKNDWEGTLIQSVAAMKGRGDLPAGLARLVDRLVKNQIDWWEVLRSHLRELCSDDWDFLTPAMELSDGPFIHPSLKAEKCGPVVFATDTSGSIDLGMLAKFQAEKQSCLDEMRPSSLLDIYCDATVQAVREYAPGDVITMDCPGGGGTSFIPVWQEIEKRGIQPKAVVFLTDLDGDFGTDPGYPTIWVTYGTTKEAPFGETIHVQ